MKALSLAAIASLTALVAAVAPFEAKAQKPALKAGAARVDVTPAEGELPRNYEGILDRLYSRAIVLDNGLTMAALITVDAGSVPDSIWRGVSRLVETELGIPAKNLLFAATHTHSAPGQLAAR
jgi:hypothetical protein